MNQLRLFKHPTFYAIVLAFASNLGAGTLPAPYFEVDMQAGYTPDGAIGLYSAVYYSPGDYSLGSGTAFLSGFPSLTEQVSVGSVASANDYAVYYFSVLGPASGDIIPLLISGSISASAAGGDAGADAELRVDTTVDEAIVGVEEGDPAWSGILHVNYLEGSSPGIVQMLAEAWNAYPTAGSAQAFADPYIYVDPSFADASDYSVIVSDGIGNGPDAPEPASFAMIGIALIGAGFLRRRYNV